MSKFSLCLPPRNHREWLLRIGEIAKITKNIQKVRLEMNWKICDQEVKTMKLILSKNFHSNLRCLSLLSLHTASDLIEILRKIPNLEELNLKLVKIDAVLLEKQEKLKLADLNTLKLDNCSWNFLQIFECPQLKSIEILYGNSSDLKHLTSFLKSLNCLESITFDGAALTTIFSAEDMQIFVCQLKKIRVLSKFPCKLSRKVDENFDKFVKSQRFLQKIEFG
jgi:hypothetical protein